MVAESFLRISPGLNDRLQRGQEHAADLMLHAAVSLSSHGHCPCSMQIGFVRCYCMALPLIAIGQVEKCWDPIG